MDPESISAAAAAEPQPGRYVRGMERLVVAVQELSLARDLASVQRIVRTAARELTGADGATFVLRDGDMCYYADEDAIAPLWKGRRFPLQACVSGWVMLNAEPAVIPDVFDDARVPVAAYRPTFVRSLAMVPIRRQAPIGAIGNYWARLYRPGKAELALLQALADTTAVALENIQVYGELEQRVRDRTAELEEANREIQRLLLSDELTGVHNRRGFMLLAEQALKRARREARLVIAVFIDVDGLKSVNDQYGHEAGDGMIVDVARAIKATFREADVIGRLGGDEFCVLVLENEMDTAQLRQRLQQKLDDFSGDERPFRLSASVGVAPIESEDDTLDALLARADQAMYFEKRAKKRGQLPSADASPTAAGPGLPPQAAAAAARARSP